MKTAIFGGSFNPVHKGHISLAAQAVKKGYTQVIFVPAKYPPHKTLSAGAGDENRLRMLELATDSLSWARIWKGELERGGLSYSIDTIDELQKANLVGQDPGLIIGNDLLEELSTWKDVDRLLGLTTLLVGKRHPDNSDHTYPHETLDNRIVSCSSTDIRESIAAGLAWEHLVPEKVVGYIRRMELYGCS